MKRMKFRLDFLKKRTHRKGSFTGTISGKKQKNDYKTVETWNEFRQIGAEQKLPRGIEEVLKQNQYDTTLQEVQDWDRYIAEFNEQYRHQHKQLKNAVTDADRDSISTVADTKSQLLESRNRRALVFRKFFIISCLILWCICFWGAHEWYLLYLIYPIGFLEEANAGFFAEYFTPRSVWIAFLLNSHSWVAGSLGLLCTFCFRENPAVLKQFILRVPYFLFVPSFLIITSVRYVGTFSSQQLSKAMDSKIPQYHNFENNTEKILKNMLNSDINGKRLWDQLQKILQCCGVDGPKDWDSVDDDLTDEISYVPSTCCPRPFVRRTWTKERPEKDDCFYKINKMENTDLYEWAYPEGCLNLAYEFFVKAGAFNVGLMVGNFCGLCLSLTFGYKYYVTVKYTHNMLPTFTILVPNAELKGEDLKFKYSWKEWFADILFLSYIKWLVHCCKNLGKTKNRVGPDRQNRTKSLVSGHQSQVSGETSVSFKDGAVSLPSVIVTAPKEGTDVEDIDAEDNVSVKIIFSEAATDPQPEDESSTAVFYETET